ncbi:MAG: winged helix-turn-helix domain-containing protein [Candidatus Competibacteraceae bacterium]
MWWEKHFADAKSVCRVAPPYGIGRSLGQKTNSDAVWSGVTVGDAALQVCIGEIRKALGDNAATPRFIQTVHRKGYRFIGRGRATMTNPLQSQPASEQPVLLGRNEIMRQLHELLSKRCKPGGNWFLSTASRASVKPLW